MSKPMGKRGSVLTPVLPHNLEAERDVLGAILLNVAGTDEALRRLDPSQFFATEYGSVFRRIKQQVTEHGGRPDVVLLSDALRSHGELEKVGGEAGLGALYDGMPRSFNILKWVEIIEQKSRLRQTAKICEQLKDMALNANGNGAEVLREIAILSAHLREEVGQKRILSFLTGPDLAQVTSEKVAWCAKPYIAKGAITELGAKVKMGKTTWILHLVRAALAGTPFMGEPTSQTPVVYLTEQPLVSFREAMHRADLLGRSDFLVLLHSEVRGLTWPEIASAAVTKCKESGALMLIVDTLPQFAGLTGDSENNSGDALAAMQPLQDAAAQDIAVVIIRHERKSGGDVGDSGRGSSAFAGAVDVVLSLRRPEGNSRKTVRALQALSRFADTPSELLIELTDCEYISLGQPHENALKEAKDQLFAAAPNTEADAVSLKDLAEATKLPRVTVQRAIDELRRDGLVGRIGKGKKRDAFRYFSTEEGSFLPNYVSVDGQNRIEPDPPPSPPPRPEFDFPKENEPE